MARWRKVGHAFKRRTNDSHGCIDKIRYDTEDQADDACYRQRFEGIDLTFYKCRYCPGYHLTSSKKDKKPAR